MFQTRLDSHLASAIALFGALSRNETPARNEAPGPAAVKAAWGGKRGAADSLCAAFRAEGAACQVFGR